MKGQTHVLLTDQRPEIAERWKIWRVENSRRLQEERGKGISSIAVFDAPEPPCAGGASCVDVGNNAYSLAAITNVFNNFNVRLFGFYWFCTSASMGAWVMARRAAGNCCCWVTGVSVNTWLILQPGQIQYGHQRDYPQQ
ncbi:MAG: hypothetical protein R2825_14595 [Saprospiraceae bacterium]